MPSESNGNIWISIDISNIISKEYYGYLQSNKEGHMFMKSILQPGDFSYFTRRFSDNSPEIDITYSDDNDTIWSTTRVPQYYINNQNDKRFQFEIIESQDYIDKCYPDSNLLVKAKFSFVIYTEYGDSITIEDGEIKSLYKWYY